VLNHRPDSLFDFRIAYYEEEPAPGGLLYPDLPEARREPKYPATTSGEHLRRLFVATQMAAAPQ
jgi:hypothetical protein